MKKRKTATLWGIWRDKEHSGERETWVDDAATLTDATLPDGDAWLTEEDARKEIEAGCEDPDHEHVAPIARLTMLPPPRVRAKKGTKHA